MHEKLKFNIANKRKIVKHCEKILSCMRKPPKLYEKKLSCVSEKFLVECCVRKNLLKSLK